MLGESRPSVWTIGHSTRTWEQFLALLKQSEIQHLADVRRFPSSRRVPWTNQRTLAAALSEEGLGYEHLEDLGGYRKARRDSRNTGWRNAGFRGYADHMGTEAFQKALNGLLDRARRVRTAVMCAEAVPWRCHRALLADALLVRGARVLHILAPGKREEHRLTSFARVHRGRLTYPGKG